MVGMVKRDVHAGQVRGPWLYLPGLPGKKGMPNGALGMSCLIRGQQARHVILLRVPGRSFVSAKKVPARALSGVYAVSEKNGESSNRGGMTRSAKPKLPSVSG